MTCCCEHGHELNIFIIILLFIKLQLRTVIRQHMPCYFVLPPTCFASGRAVIRDTKCKGHIRRKSTNVLRLILNKSLALSVCIPYIYIYMCVCVCVCIYICVCVYIYIHTYIYIYIQREREREDEGEGDMCSILQCNYTLTYVS